MNRTVQLMARCSLSIPSVALILWVLLTHFCSGVRVEQGATVGESVTFACTVNVSGSVSWQWSKDGVVLTQSNSRVVGVGTANLTILSVEESDFGNYSCSLNPADSQLRQDFMLSVSPATVVSVLPSPVVLVNRTGSINLECVAGGGPENTFQWYYDNQLLPGETYSVLELTDIGLSGGGYFNCTVTNAAGTGSNTALVVGPHNNRNSVSQTHMWPQSGIGEDGPIDEKEVDTIQSVVTSLP